jgi:hypothetical protein
MKGISALLALTCIVTLSIVAPAPLAALSAEDARVCRELAIKAHPTQLAGSVQGSAQAQRTYFQDCIAKRQSGSSNAGSPKDRRVPSQK